jgi:hypothetical protein
MGSIINCDRTFPKGKDFQNRNAQSGNTLILRTPICSVVKSFQRGAGWMGGCFGHDVELMNSSSIVHNLDCLDLSQHHCLSSCSSCTRRNTFSDVTAANTQTGRLYFYGFGASSDQRRYVISRGFLSDFFSLWKYPHL